MTPSLIQSHALWCLNDAINEVLPWQYDYESRVESEEDAIRVDVLDKNLRVGTFLVTRHSISLATHETLVDLVRKYVVALLGKAMEG